MSVRLGAYQMPTAEPGNTGASRAPVSAIAPTAATAAARESRAARTVSGTSQRRARNHCLRELDAGREQEGITHSARAAAPIPRQGGTEWCVQQEVGDGIGPSAPAADDAAHEVGLELGPRGGERGAEDAGQRDDERDPRECDPAQTGPPDL